MNRDFKTVYTIDAVEGSGYTLAVYPCQEGVHFERDKPIRFEVTLTKGDQPCSDGDLHAYFNWNSERVVWHRFLEIKDGKAQIDFVCEQSGFGNLHVLYYRDGEEIVEQVRGVAVSPDRLRRSYPCPDDFDAFWAEKAQILDGPFEARYERIDHDSHPQLHANTHKDLLKKDLSEVDIFDTQVDCPVKDVSGILTLPKNRKPRSLPAVLWLHGAGVRPCQPERFVEQAERGAMIYEINAHGIPNDRTPDWYTDIAKTGVLKDYEAIGRDSRDKHYFINMFLRVKRGLQFLMSREEWDGQVLVTMGGSQGAAQAYAGAYLEDRVSALVGYIPAYGDLTGFLQGHKVNWPDWLHLKPRGCVDRNAIEVATYIDAVNFLRNYDREACFCWGLQDQGCLPTTSYVPVSECPADATVILQPDLYHSACAEADAMMWDFIFDHAKAVTQQSN